MLAPAKEVMGETLYFKQKGKLLDVDNIVNAAKNNGELLKITLTSGHELDLHAIDYKDKKNDKSASEEHSEGYNENLRGYSPAYKDIKKDSPQGRMKEKIKKQIRKQIINHKMLRKKELNHKRRLPNRIGKIFTLFLLTLFFVGCYKKDKELFFQNLDNKRYNVLDIEYSHFKIDGKQIYLSNSIEIGNNFFSKTNYFLVDSLKVYSIFRNLGQTEEDLNKILKKKDSNRVNFLKTKTGLLVLDYGLRIKDSLHKKPGDLILFKKLYDEQLKDTVFIFSRKFLWDTDITNIVATKKYGVIGFYDYYYKNKVDKEVYKYYGWTYLWLLDTTYKISPLRQLNPYSITNPSLNLKKMIFLAKD